MNPTDKPSRTFSLARLMAGVTVVCVVCGLGVNFPEAAQVILGLIFCFLPTIVVFLVLACYTRDRVGLAIHVFVGAVLDTFVALVLPPLHGRGTIGWAYFITIIWLPPAIGALVFGGSVVSVLMPSQRPDEQER